MTNTNNKEMQVKALNMLLAEMEESAECFEFYQSADSAKAEEVWKRQFLNRAERERAIREMCVEVFGLDEEMLCLRNDVKKLIDELEGTNNTYDRCVIHDVFAEMACEMTEMARSTDDKVLKARYAAAGHTYRKAAHAVMDVTRSLYSVALQYNIHEWSHWAVKAEKTAGMNTLQSVRCDARALAYKRCGEIIMNYLSAEA